VRAALWGGALLVGLAATLFAIGSEAAYELFMGLIDHSPYWALLTLPAGLMFATWLTRRFFPGAQGSGIPQVLAASESGMSTEARRGILSLRIAIGKMLMTMLGLLSGASIGREGPTVHVGAAIMYSMGHWLKFPPHHLERALILAGGAAGISAAFNTPLAGIVFAIEEIARSFEDRTSGIVLTAVILAGLVALMIQGNYAYFGTSHAAVDTITYWYLIPISGVVGGLLGGLFSQSLIRGSRALAPVYKRHPLLLAALCGLLVAGVGIYSGGTTYGTGYAEARAIIDAGEGFDPLYPLLKVLATVGSYLSGIPGGIFAPTLAAGAGIGADLALWFPLTLGPAIILLGMVGYFTGVVQTPITAFVIVMEMTDNQTMLLPLMATAFIAYSSSRMVCPVPIYQALSTAFTSAMIDARSRKKAEEHGVTLAEHDVTLTGIAKPASPDPQPSSPDPEAKP